MKTSFNLSELIRRDNIVSVREREAEAALWQQVYFYVFLLIIPKRRMKKNNNTYAQMNVCHNDRNFHLTFPRLFFVVIERSEKETR